MQFPSASSAPTKREVLAKLAKVYDPLGLASPITLQGKQIYREACHCKVSWDAPIPENLKIRWQRWEQSLPAEVTTRRPLAPYQQPVSPLSCMCLGTRQLTGSEQQCIQSYAKKMESLKPWLQKSKISQERTNRPQVGVSQCSHGYQFSHQRKKRPKGTTRTHDLRLAGQHRHPPLDCREMVSTNSSSLNACKK